MTIIRFRRGNKANMPASAPSGMPLWCEDTKELYLGTGDNVELIGKNTDISNISGTLIPYSVNYGNCDSNGYADLIQKVSDTEISFKVGGTYPNICITFPNGNHYEIAEIPNISGLNVDTKYTFVIFKENLTELENDTYRAVAIAVQVGYEQVERIPALTSDSHEGYTATYLGTLGFDPYNIFDDNADTNVYAYHSGWPPQGYYPAGSLDTSEGISRCSSFVLTFDEIKNIEYLVVKSNPYGSGGRLNYLTSTDGGVTWSDPSANITLTNTTAIDIKQNVNAIKFRFYHGYTVVDDLAFPGQKWYTRWQISVTDIDIYEKVAYPGGAIAEDVKFPEDYDQSIVPAMTAYNSGGWTASASNDNGGMEAYRAFDGSYADNNRWYTGANNIGWLKIVKDSGTFDISRIAITAPEDATYTSTPKDFTIKDEADNVLATFTNQIYSPNETKYFDVTGNNISAIKIDVTSTNGGSGITAKEVKLYTAVTSQAGDLVLLTNQIPLRSYLRDSSGWIEKQFVKLGQVQKISGLIGTPISYAFNGICRKVVPIPSSRWQAVNVDMNIGSEYQAQGNLICITANNGYSAGQKGFNFLNRDSSGGSATFPPLKFYDENTLTLLMCEAYAISYHTSRMSELLIGYGSTTWEVELIAKRSF